MLIRPYNSDDKAKVCSIHEQSCTYPMPDLDNALYVVKEVAENNGEVIGLGTIRLSSEVILILDTEQKRSVRAKAIEELIRTGIYKCQKLGMDEMHAFLTGDVTHSFAQSLKNKFGFVDCEGIPLTLRLRS